MSSNGSALKGSAPDLTKQVLVQKLAQQIVNQIVSDDVIDDKIEEEENQNKEPTCCQMFCAPFTLKYYQPFFNDLTTKVIAQKLMASFFPFKATFFEIQDGKADLYGPVWIYATLVFSVAAAGNISGYLATPSNIAFHYNFDFIPTASSLLFGIALLVPFAIYMVMKMLGGRHLHLSSVICIYAYAQTCIIPVCIVCSIPNPQLQWGALIYAMINSSLFLIVNYWGELEKNIQAKKHIVIWLIAGCQVVLLLLFKMYFFLYVLYNLKRVLIFQNYANIDHQFISINLKTHQDCLNCLIRTNQHYKSKSQLDIVSQMQRQEIQRVSKENLFEQTIYTNPYTGSRFDQLTKINHSDHSFLHHQH